MSHDLSTLGFRKPPFTRELQVRECFPLEPQAQVAAPLTEAVQERMSAALIAPCGAPPVRLISPSEGVPYHRFYRLGAWRPPARSPTSGPHRRPPRDLSRPTSPNPYSAIASHYPTVG